MRFTVLLVALLACGVDSLSAAEGPEPAAGADPMVWETPKVRPVFREVVKGDDFQKQLASAVPEDEFAKLQKSNDQIVGCEIVNIVAGSVAERLGIPVGATIVAVDGRPLWLGWMRTDIDRTVDLVEASGKRSTFEVPAGVAGIIVAPRWRPELIHVRGKQRSEKWNRFVLAGIKLRGVAPDVAETAWHHAVTAGYEPDFLSDQCGAEIAQLQGRSAAALDFAAFARRADAEKGELVPPRLLFRIAMANYKLRDALRLMEESPWAFMGTEEQPDPIGRLIAIHEKRPPAAGPDLAPSERYEKLKKTDLLPGLTGLKGNAEGMDVAKWLREKPRMQAPSNEYTRLRLAPKDKVRDMELLVRYRFKPTDDKPMRFLKVMQAGILDPRENEEAPDETPRYIAPTLTTFTDVNGQCQWIASNWSFIHYWADPRIRPDGKTEHEIRILRYHGRGEIFINGARVLYTPLRDDIDRACILLQAVGTSVDITQLRAVGLSE